MNRSVSIGILSSLTAVLLCVIFIISIKMDRSNVKRPYNYGCPYGRNGKYCDPCGVSYQPLNVRVIGGIEAQPHSYPAQVFVIFDYAINLLLKPTNQTLPVRSQHSCGGTLINRDSVLTAAHCLPKTVDTRVNEQILRVKVKVNPLRPTYGSMFHVYLAVHKLTSEMFSDFSEAENISQVFVHEQFDDPSLENDIAILKLSREIELNEKIQLACLPDPLKNEYPQTYEKKFILQGWGSTLDSLNKNHSILPELQNARISNVDLSKCSKKLNETLDSKKQICAGDFENYTSACHGDSGGAIYIEDEVDGKNKLVASGIVSFGIEKCEKFFPAVFTRISYYLKWIDSHI